MKVPAVVQMASVMMAHIATDGPDDHWNQVSPRNSWSASQAGGFSVSTSPVRDRIRCPTPRGSANQFGPLIPNHASTALTAPDAVNRNRNTSEMATDDVTDGK